MTQFSTVLAFSAIEVAIPKLLWSERGQRYLTFREAFDSDRPGHYGYGGINRVGRDFLTKYESLFGDRGR
jgi:hypothetical protein